MDTILTILLNKMTTMFANGRAPQDFMFKYTLVYSPCSKPVRAI